MHLRPRCTVILSITLKFYHVQCHICYKINQPMQSTTTILCPPDQTIVVSFVRIPRGTHREFFWYLRTERPHGTAQRAVAGRSEGGQTACVDGSSSRAGPRARLFLLAALRARLFLRTTARASKFGESVRRSRFLLPFFFGDPRS